jgi:hypothetical protein
MLIKTPGPTLAPFVQGEKPQVFPAPAAGFGKNGQSIGLLRAAGADRRFERPGKCRVGCACFCWLLQRSDAAR